MIKFTIGNMFESNSETLVNTVNCVGVMGKGVALEFKNKYPEMYNDYVLRCKQKQVKPGDPYLYTNLAGDSILNFPTKDDWRSMSHITHVINGLEWFVENYEQLDINSISFPPLGCGNGGLLWEDVGPLMYKYLNDLSIDIIVYAPFGTNQKYLSTEFLSNEKDIVSRIGKRANSSNKNWVCILEVIRRLNENKYSCYIGRTSYQKICYILQHYGLDCGFVFKQGAYGPYSVEAKEAFNIMSNANYVIEKKIGKIDAIFTTNYFRKALENNEDIINKNFGVIENVMQIFSRIKNTKQAEIFTTILFSYTKAKKETLSERDLLNYILKWKPHWENDRNVISETIRDMLCLKYIDIDYSKDFILEYDF